LSKVDKKVGYGKVLILGNKPVKQSFCFLKVQIFKGRAYLVNTAPLKGLPSSVTIRQSVFGKCLTYLGESHPSLSFIKEELNEVDTSYTSNQILS